jgi:integrase
MTLVLQENKLYSNFINSLRSPDTKKHYSYVLKQFMAFHKIDEYSTLMVMDKEEKIKEYVVYLVSQGASTSRFRILFAALKNFYEMNDVENINWHKLKRFMGEEVPKHEDRRYYHEEIHALVTTANMKLKAAILLMASSGVRIGSLPLMLVGHLEKKVDLYKINVYKDQKGKGQYYTFCTPETVQAIDTYLKFRERCGEKVTDKSPLFRKDFDTDFHEQARNDIEVCTMHSIAVAVRRELIKNGLITVDHVNPRTTRKDVKQSHGFRKFFETMLVNSGIHETIIRKLTGHSDSNNLTQLYSKQTEEEMLLEYGKAIEVLTNCCCCRTLETVSKIR